MDYGEGGGGGDGAEEERERTHTGHYPDNTEEGKAFYFPFTPRGRVGTERNNQEQGRGQK